MSKMKRLISKLKSLKAYNNQGDLSRTIQRAEDFDLNLQKV